MTRTREPHVIKASCPLACIERQLSTRAYQAIRRHLQQERIFHPTVRHVVALYRNDGLSGVHNLGAQGVEMITSILEKAGVIPLRSQATETETGV
jgi:hypothetical protein